MLFEAAVADAYGIAFEFCDNTDDRPNDLAKYYQNPRYPELKPGMYTDDTMRMIANAQVLLFDNPFDPRSYIKRYVTNYRNDQRKGWSKRFQRILQESIDSSSDDACAAVYFNDRIIRQATSNGAIMGAAVLGFLKYPADVAMAAAVQAMSTHSSETVPYAQAIALMAHEGIYHYDRVGFKDTMFQYISSDTMVDWRTRPQGKVRVSARDTYSFVASILARAQNLSDIMRLAVEQGGDTDSVAAIATAIASPNPRRFNDIPQHLKDTLENGSKTKLAALDLMLKLYSKGLPYAESPYHLESQS